MLIVRFVNPLPAADSSSECNPGSAPTQADAFTVASREMGYPRPQIA